MGLDANIILQGKLPEFQNPLAKYAQVAQLEQAQNTNALAQYSLAKAQREDADTNAIRNILRNAGGDMDAGQNALMKGGYYEKALALKKSQQEQSKTESEITRNKAAAGETQAKAVAKSAETYRDLLANVNDPRTAAQWVQAGYSHPVLGPIFSQHGTVEQSLAMIPQDPAAFAGWKRENALGASKFAEVSKPNIQVRNTGGSTDVLVIDPFTGQPKITSSVRNTMSPDAIAADARGRESNAISRERLTLDKQNGGKPQYDAERGIYVSPNGASTPVVGSDGKPIGAKDKSLTETQGKSTAFAARMESADKIIGDLIAGGTKTPSLLKQSAESVPLIGTGLGVAANNFASPNQQRMEQAQRDFVNAVLRQESGAAISPAEFESARRQYFPQPGDSSPVIAQKAQNRRISIEGMKTQAGPGAKSIPGIVGGGGTSGAKPSLSDIFGH